MRLLRFSTYYYHHHHHDIIIRDHHCGAKLNSGYVDGSFRCKVASRRAIHPRICLQSLE